MAGSTTNLGLIKPLGSEKIRIAQINQNSDTLDAAIGAVGSTSLQAQLSAIEDGIAIVANGDSHVAITAGQFVYVRNNTHNLEEGLYVASANVSANASITSSNMTADASGGLNALNNNTNRREVQKAVYSQLKDNGDLTTSTLTAYPTTAGLFRVGSKSACPGLPADSNGYGPLLIFNAGGYVLHVHKAANGRMWYGYTENAISAPSSWIEIAQNDKISANALGSMASMADLKSALNTLATSIGSGVGTFSFVPTFTDNDAGFFNATYGERIGTIYVRDATHFSCVITYNGGIDTLMANREGTWVIDQFALKRDVFKTTPYSGGSSSYEITCPITINDGSNFLALLKHFGATGVYNVDLVLLIRSGNNLYYSYIVHNSSANITAASYSGDKITLTFNANVYMSAHLIVTQ